MSAFELWVCRHCRVLFLAVFTVLRVSHECVTPPSCVSFLMRGCLALMYRGWRLCGVRLRVRPAAVTHVPGGRVPQSTLFVRRYRVGFVVGGCWTRHRLWVHRATCDPGVSDFYRLWTGRALRHSHHSQRCASVQLSAWGGGECACCENP